ncbi:hypothetical protein NL676_021170 [Syzygium grande]|nr:hypothetical protein NL676_021170 [Syzygium grande]
MLPEEKACGGAPEEPRLVRQSEAKGRVDFSMMSFDEFLKATGTKVVADVEYPKEPDHGDGDDVVRFPCQNSIPFPLARIRSQEKMNKSVLAPLSFVENGPIVLHQHYIVCIKEETSVKLMEEIIINIT